MLLNEFNFIPTRVNEAVNDILPQMLTAVDKDGTKLLFSAEQIDSLSIEDVARALQPPPDECPCVRAKIGKVVAPQPGVSFVRVDEYFRLSLYFIYYGGVPNFEELRRCHIDACIRVLEQPDQGSAIGLDQIGSPKWTFQISPWEYEEDYDTPLRYWDKNVTLTADYYVARVDLMVEINEIGAQND